MVILFEQKKENLRLSFFLHKKGEFRESFRISNDCQNTIFRNKNEWIASSFQHCFL